jgi:hypothetical protein
VIQTYFTIGGNSCEKKQKKTKRKGYIILFSTDGDFIFQNKLAKRYTVRKLFIIMKEKIKIRETNLNLNY